MKNALLMGALLSATFISSNAYAQHGDNTNHQNHDSHRDHNEATTPNSIVGSHIHDKGEWMVSYRYMRMDMDGNRDGTDNLFARQISGGFPNPTGTGPSTLRVVPVEMQTDMHMLGAMYGLTDTITLMAMASYIEREMDHITFAGGNPALETGRFTTESEGLGDTKLAGLFEIYRSGSHSLIARAGLSLPTGSITEEDTILNPMGARQRVRLPYAMQLGSGTYDLEPALTYSGAEGRMGWGAQYMGQIRLGENAEDYTLGDKHMLSAWGGYQWSAALANTVRLSAEREGQIDDRDDQISGPVQTANPDNYGGDRVMLGLGMNFNPVNPKYQQHRFGAELTLPLYQDLNGPQLERDYAFTLNYGLNF